MCGNGERGTNPGTKKFRGEIYSSHLPRRITYTTELHEPLQRNIQLN